MITREQAEALIQEQLINTIQQDAPKASTVMALARKLPNMTSKQTRIPVLDMLPMAYWVTGDTGYKQTSKQAWDNVYLTAEELAVIVPIPEAVIDDASFDILGEVQPRIVEAIGYRVDQAIIFGLNKPASWPVDLITFARQAGNNVTGTSIDYDTFLGEGGLFNKVEEGGYGVTGGIADMGMKAVLRGLKDDADRPIFKTDMQGPTPYALDGAPIRFPENGSFDKTIARMIVGDWSKMVYSIRQDITVKILDQGVIQDPSNGNIVYNLAQQDMIALRVVMRMAYALPNPVTRMNNDGVFCPFAYLEPTTAVTTYTATFTISDNASSPAAVENAVIDVAGAKLKTNSSGQAVFNLRAGTYTVKVKKAGYKTTTSSITVESSNITKSITLPIDE